MLNNVSELAALQSSFNEAVNVIRAELHDAGLPELSTYSSESHPLDDPSFLCSSRLYEARKLALASIGQLKVLLQMPYEKVIEQSCAVYDTASLDIFIKTGILDLLLEPDNIGTGLSVSQLASLLDLDPVKLVAILRYLATQGWVYEKQDSVFCITRVTLELRNGSNGRRWALTPGKPRVALSLLDQMTHPEWKYSNSPAETAFQLAHNTSLTLFQHLKQHPEELKQWASSVRSYGDAYQAGLLKDYPWHELSTSLIVDCGGGQGYLTMALAETLPHCKFIIQDLPEVVCISQKNLEIEMPLAVKSGRISSEAHSFFDTQPAKPSGTVFAFRYILHDWPDSDCIKILKNTVALNEESRVLIIEYVGATSTPSLPNTIKTQPVVSLDDLTASKRHRRITPPAFIPANFGATAKTSLAVGVHMMGVFNARERSLIEWRDIIEKAGLVIAQLHPLRANVSVIECKPR